MQSEQSMFIHPVCQSQSRTYWRVAAWMTSADRSPFPFTNALSRCRGSINQANGTEHTAHFLNFPYTRLAGEIVYNQVVQDVTLNHGGQEAV